MITVYLVDDHAMMRDGLRAVLEAHGHSVVGESADPVQALAELRQLAPDILLLDLRINDHSGLDLLAKLKTAGIKTRTIILTISEYAGHVSQALRSGALGYVLKGAPSSELLKAIQTVNQGRRHISSAIASIVLDDVAMGDMQTGLQSLSKRERQVVELVVRGKSSAEIGALLNLSPKTVETYRSRLMGKLGVNDVTALVRFAVREGLIPPDEV